jgi:hypothetical protein
MSHLNDSILSKKIFNFKRSFNYLTGELENIDTTLNVEVDLVIDLINDQFYIDFTNPFNTEKGIVNFFGPNIMGNVREKAKISAEYYKWIAEIVEFAEEELTSLTIEYDILKDVKVIDVAVEFADYLDDKVYINKRNDVMTDYSPSQFKKFFAEFVEWKNRKSVKHKKKPGCGSQKS